MTFITTTAPSLPPQNVRLTSIDVASFNVTWESPPEIHQNGQITGYDIVYYCQWSEMFDKVNVTVNATTTQYNISALTPFVSYVVKIAARNVNGTGIFFEAAPVSVQKGEHMYVSTQIYYKTATYIRKYVYAVFCNEWLKINLNLSTLLVLHSNPSCI